MQEEAPPKPNRFLQHRVAIVTGAGTAGTGIGNGRASAILLAEAGADVVCVDVAIALAEATVTMITDSAAAAPGSDSSRSPSFGPPIGRAAAYAADVTDPAQCAAAVKFAIEKFGRLDVLVNVVGMMGVHGSAIDVDMAQWSRCMEVNVSSMVLMAKYAIPEMCKNSEPGQAWKGSIVNIGSVAGLQGGTPHLFYPTSKGAIVNMTRAMAHHHAADGIRVNCVCPGMLYTPHMYSGGMTAEVREARRSRSLLKTEGNGWDCGATVRFLASDEARWITGIALPVDAGATASTAIDVGTK